MMACIYGTSKTYYSPHNAFTFGCCGVAQFGMFQARLKTKDPFSVILTSFYYYCVYFISKWQHVVVHVVQMPMALSLPTRTAQIKCFSIDFRFTILAPHEYK